MSSNNTKYYLRPFGFIPLKDIDLQKNNVIEVRGNHYSNIELIKKEKRRVSRTNYLVEDFYKLADNNKYLQKYLNSLKNKKIVSNHILKKKKSLIFSILNVTPDSFSDGGENLNFKNNITKAEQMIKDGADFIDIGGESTRPGASKVKASDEILRVLPTIQALNHKKINLSLDTRNSSTMELGILAGVKIINDVSALKNDKTSIDILTKYKTPVILMHMPGTPKTMMKNTNYFDVVLDVYDFLEERIKFCESKGIDRNNIIIDPGIGFGKNLDDNIKLLKQLSIFHTLDCPIMLGISRKRFISAINKNSEPKERLGGTISTTIHAMMQGIKIHRVHDVKEARQAIDVFEKINEK